MDENQQQKKSRSLTHRSAVTVRAICVSSVQQKKQQTQQESLLLHSNEQNATSTLFPQILDGIKVASFHVDIQRIADWVEIEISVVCVALCTCEVGYLGGQDLKKKNATWKSCSKRVRLSLNGV